MSSDGVFLPDIYPFNCKYTTGAVSVILTNMPADAPFYAQRFLGKFIKHQKKEGAITANNILFNIL